MIKNLSEDYEVQIRKLSADTLIKLDNSFDKFKAGVNPKQVETMCEAKQINLKKEYEKRLDNAEGQKKCDTKNMTKICNDTLTGLNYAYECDMKAMGDSHNDSVMRMQIFHEGKVQDMSKNYKTKGQLMIVKCDKNIRQSGQKISPSFNDLENQNKLELEEIADDHKKTVDDVKDCHEVDRQKYLKKFMKDIHKLKELAEQLEKHNSEVRKAHEKVIKTVQNKHKMEFQSTKRHSNASSEAGERNRQEKLSELRKIYEEKLDETQKQKKSNIENITKLCSEYLIGLKAVYERDMKALCDPQNKSVTIMQ